MKRTVFISILLVSVALCNGQVTIIGDDAEDTLGLFDLYSVTDIKELPFSSNNIEAKQCFFDTLQTRSSLSSDTLFFVEGVDAVTHIVDRTYVITNTECLTIFNLYSAADSIRLCSWYGDALSYYYARNAKSPAIAVLYQPIGGAVCDWHLDNIRKWNTEELQTAHTLYGVTGTYYYTASRIIKCNNRIVDKAVITYDSFACPDTYEVIRRADSSNIFLLYYDVQDLTVLKVDTVGTCRH